MKTKITNTSNKINIKTNNAAEMLANSQKVLICVTGGFHSESLKNVLVKQKFNVITVTPNISGNEDISALRYSQIINYQSVINSQALTYTLLSCLNNSEKRNILLQIINDLAGEDATNILKQITNDKYVYLRQDIFRDAYSDKEKRDIENIITGTVDEILSALPNNWQDLAVISNVDDIFLKMVTKLVEHGIIFSKGKIFEIENSLYNNEDLYGVPAEIYSRIIPSLQKVLLEKHNKTKQS